MTQGQRGLLKTRKAQKAWGFAALRIDNLAFSRVYSIDEERKGYAYGIAAQSPFNAHIIAQNQTGGLDIVASDGSYALLQQTGAAANMDGAPQVYLAIDPANGYLYQKEEASGVIHETSLSGTVYAYVGIVGSLPAGAVEFNQQLTQGIYTLQLPCDVAAVPGGKGMIENVSHIFVPTVAASAVTLICGKNGLFEPKAIGADANKVVLQDDGQYTGAINYAIYVWMSGELTFTSGANTDTVTAREGEMSLQLLRLVADDDIEITGRGVLGFVFVFVNLLSPSEFAYFRNWLNYPSEPPADSLLTAVSFDQNSYKHIKRISGNFFSTSFTVGQTVNFSGGASAKVFFSTSPYIDVTRETAEITAGETVSGVTVTGVEEIVFFNDYSTIVNFERVIPFFPERCRLENYENEDIGLDKPYALSKPVYNRKIKEFFSLKDQWDFALDRIRMDGSNDFLTASASPAAFMDYGTAKSFALSFKFLFADLSDVLYCSKLEGAFPNSKGWALTVNRLSGQVLFEMLSNDRNNPADALRVTALESFENGKLYDLSVSYDADIALLPGNIIPSARLTLKITGKTLVLATAQQTLLSTDTVQNTADWQLGQRQGVFGSFDFAAVSGSGFGLFDLKNHFSGSFTFPQSDGGGNALLFVGKTLLEIDEKENLENIGSKPSLKPLGKGFLKCQANAGIDLPAPALALSGEDFAMTWIGTVSQAFRNYSRCFMIKNNAVLADPSGVVTVSLADTNFLNGTPFTFAPGQPQFFSARWNYPKYEDKLISMVYTQHQGFTYFYLDGFLVGGAPLAGSGINNSPTVARLCNFEFGPGEGMPYDGLFKEAAFIRGKGLSRSEVYRYLRALDARAFNLPASQLIGHWVANQKGGTVLPDISGNGNHGTLTGFSNTTEGNTNNAWKDELKIAR